MIKSHLYVNIYIENNQGGLSLEKFLNYEGVFFKIHDNRLVAILNKYKDPIDAFIPSVFSSGERIESIGPVFCHGEFSTITIDDKISRISGRAFKDAEVDRVVWPASCTTIPIACFEFSSIKELSNIESVVEIEESAFYCSDINDFKWPANCKIVPKCCFEVSQLKTISNTYAIEKIEKWAFKGCSLQSFSFPSKCTSVPDGCFMDCHIEKLLNLQNIYNIDSSAFAFAVFSEKLDFSASIGLNIERCAFKGVAENMVVLPYYIPAEMIEKAFSE